MNPNLDPQTEEKIQAARTLPEQKHGNYGVEGRSIWNLLGYRVQEDPGREFLVYYGDDDRKRVSYNYIQFAQNVAKLADALAKNYQIGRGDRVATLMFNHPDTVLSYFAVWSLGAVLVPINVEESDDRVAYILKNSGAKLCLVASEMAPRAKASASFLPLLFSQSNEKESVESILLNSAVDFAPSGVNLHDEALIVYTSGTTGMPKGVVLTQYNLLADARAISQWQKIQSGGRMMCVLPIHHVNGIVVTLMTPLYASATVVLNRRFSATRFWKTAAAERVEIVSVVPTLLHFLVERNEDLSRYDLKAFRHLICGAGPLTVELAARFEKLFGFPVIHGYGLSETTCYSCFLPLDLSKSEHTSWMQDYGFPSIGVPLPCNEMAIHDSQGNALSEELRGEIVIRGHNVMKGYYENPQANQTTFEHGWFRSGDEGFFSKDAKGRSFFFITGRIKELIARGGVKFAPLEIDEILNSIPGVRRGVAVGFDNDAYGEEVGAYVELEPESALSEATILEACRKKLSAAKCPKVVKFGKEIPLTSTGKIQRIKLKPLFAEYKSKQF